jgi:hypothetical protein
VSSTRPTRALWLALVGVPLLFVLIAVLQKGIEVHVDRDQQNRDALMLRSPSAVKAMSLGYDSLLADVYWTRTVQYYGQQISRESGQFDLLWPLLDITTSLDPKLIPAYRFGAIFLAEPNGFGAGRTDLAVNLVKRGIAANPDSWILDYDLGFLYYWHLRDYKQAARAYLQGSRVPHAPSELAMMAARMEQKGGSIDTSRILWSQIYDSAGNKATRDLALRTLKGLKAKDDEIHLDALAEEYQTRFGHYPSSIGEMRASGFLSGIPVDPDGYPYVIGTGGKSNLDPRSKVAIPPEAQSPPAEFPH